jgi:hypothetical protein
MGFFKTAFSVLSMAMTGTVVNQIDTPIMGGNCQMSLRLKRKGDDSDAYVVLAGIASGNYQYYAMNAEEFTHHLLASLLANARQQKRWVSQVLNPSYGLWTGRRPNQRRPNGGRDRDRTCDPLDVNEVLSR